MQNFEKDSGFFDVSIIFEGGLPPSPNDSTVVPFLPSRIVGKTTKTGGRQKSNKNVISCLKDTSIDYYIIIKDKKLAVIRTQHRRTVAGLIEYEELRVGPHLPRPTWVSDFGLDILTEIKKGSDEHRHFHSLEGLLKSLLRLSKNAYAAVIDSL